LRHFVSSGLFDQKLALLVKRFPNPAIRLRCQPFDVNIKSAAQKFGTGVDHLQIGVEERTVGCYRDRIVAVVGRQAGLSFDRHTRIGLCDCALV